VLADGKVRAFGDKDSVLRAAVEVPALSRSSAGGASPNGGAFATPASGGNMASAS
jgi:hypothetical protein